MMNKDMQIVVLDAMADLTETMKRKVVVLSALDRDGDWDLNDQISTLFSLQEKFEEVLKRSKNILGA
tara:strand:- start:251 stop:451 length:201 start_codon:yes stop_codon:yes gene_type:complete